MAPELDPELIARVNYEMAIFGRLTAETAEAYSFAKTGIKDFAAKMNAATGAANALADTFVSYNKAVYNGKSANQAAADSTDKFAEAVKYAAVGLALMIPGGIVIKAVVAGLGLLAAKFIEAGKEVALQTDLIYNAFRDLGKAGATGAGGMQDVFDGLQKVGLGTEKFSEYLKLVNDNANDLALFGGTVTRGRKEFEKTMGSFSNQQKVQMELMGLDASGRAAATMDYIKQQRLLTIGTKTQMDTSSAAVMRFLAETDALTRVTGANREEQQKILDKAMGEEIFASFLDDLESQGEEGKKRAKSIRDNNVLAERLLGPEMARGIRDSLTGFVGASDASKKAFMSSNGAVQDYAFSMANTTMDQQQSTAEFAKLNKAIANTYTTQVQSLARMGVSESTFVKNSEARRSVAVEALGIEKSLANAKSEQLARDADPNAKSQAETAVETQRQQLALQKMVNLGMPAYIKGIKTASDANGTAVTFIDKLAAAAASAAKTLGYFASNKETQLVTDLATNATDIKQTDTSLAAAEKKLKQANITKDEKEQAENDIKFLGEKKIRLAKEKDILQKQQINEELDAEVLKQAEKNTKQKKFAVDELEKTMTPQQKLGFGRTAIQQKAYDEKKQAEKEESSLFTRGAVTRTALESNRATAREKLQKGGFKSERQQQEEKQSAAAPGAAPTGPGHRSAVGGGAAEAKLKTSQVTSTSGKSAPVNSEYASRFQSLIDHLDQSGYIINSLGGYEDRDVREQPGRKSVHASGGAIDINPGTNPMRSTLVTDLPADSIAYAKSLGLGWGGDWKASKDAMHFSVAKNEGGNIEMDDGGVAVGPNSGYPATLHGTEAVIPMNNNSGDFVKMFKTMAEMMSRQADSMDELIRETKNSNDIQNKMLQVVRS